MVQPAEARRREKRQQEAEKMAEAAAVVRHRGPGGFAGLDDAAAVAELLEVVAEQWREKPAAPRVWEAATRVAERCLEPDHDPTTYFPGPLPAGYESPVSRRDVTDWPL